jgi:hypothetical protein
MPTAGNESEAAGAKETKYTNRRRFERRPVSDETIAYHENGGRLGLVTVAGGGGMAIRLENAGARFTPGERFPVSVVETAGNQKNRFQVRVVYLRDGSLGLEFV